MIERADTRVRTLARVGRLPLVVVVLAIIALAAIAPSPANAASVQFFTTSGTIADGDPDQTGRITNGTGLTSCANPTTATLNTATGARNFDAYTLANNLATTACITVGFDQSCAGSESLQYSAYLDSFDPTNPLANHLGDSGAGQGEAQTNKSFSFNVPPNRSFVVKVNATDVGGTCAGGYTLRVSSDPQQPPAPPETVIQSGPSGDQTSTDASFAFSSNQTPVTFQCSLDSATFTPCSSPKGLTGLALGTHVFQVRAIHATNGTDPTPATRAFNVVAPVTVPVPTPTPTGDDNAFTIGELHHTTLTLTVPGAGAIDVSDASASKQEPLLKHSSAIASGAGQVEVILKLTKTARKELKKKGKVKVQATIAFTPAGGAASTQEKVLKVRK